MNAIFIDNKVINVRNGKYGHYLQILINNKSKNIPIPKNINIDNIDIENIKYIINELY